MQVAFLCSKFINFHFLNQFLKSIPISVLSNSCIQVNYNFNTLFNETFCLANVSGSRSIYVMNQPFSVLSTLHLPGKEKMDENISGVQSIYDYFFSVGVAQVFHLLSIHQEVLKNEERRSIFLTNFEV